MNIRTLIAGKRSDHETPDPVTFDGDYDDGRDLTEALQDVEEPHGIARPEVLAAIVAQAKVTVTPPERKPTPAPETFLRPVAPPAPPMPHSGVSAIWVNEVRYPDADGTSGDPRSYPEALRHIGKATGTSTSYEHDSAWRRALDPPALPAVCAPEATA